MKIVDVNRNGRSIQLRALLVFDTELIICLAAAIRVQITAGPWGLLECYHVTISLFQLA